MHDIASELLLVNFAQTVDTGLSLSIHMARYMQGTGWSREPAPPNANSAFALGGGAGPRD